MQLQPTLTGARLELRPLREDDFEALYAAASDPLIWEQHPCSDRHERAVFRKFFDDALASKGAFAIVDRATGDYIGSSRYYDLDLDKSAVAIGFTFLTRKYWGGSYNAELKRLMVDHAFGSVERALFHVHERNMRSRRAMEKIGGVLRGSFQQPGRAGLTLVYELARGRQTK